MSFPFLERFARPLLFAHRGLSSQAPENTMAAFSLAWEKGVPGVELDARLCASGELVVFHDDDLARLCGTESRISDLTLAEIGEFRVDGERIPTLEEVLAAAPAESYFDIELKVDNGNGRELVAELRRMLDRFDGRYLISSFYPSAVRAAKTIRRPENPGGIPVAWIFGESLAREERFKFSVASMLSRAPILKPQWRYAVDMLEMPTRRAKPVIPWTVNDANVAERCIALGAEGIISDDPTGFS
jgi:glycerophosphoryl diester phosphodiesterase